MSARQLTVAESAEKPGRSSAMPDKPFPDRIGMGLGRYPSGREPAVLAERQEYQSPRNGRAVGTIGVVAIIAMLGAGVMATFDQAARRPTAPQPLVVTLLPAAPPPPEPVEVTRSKPASEQKHPVEQKRTSTIAPPVVQAPSVQAPSVVRPVTTTDAEPQVAQPAPPALAAKAAEPQPQADHGPDRWEGRVLARLERFRHYPPDAQRTRQQGTVLIRFRMDRSGRVLSSSIARSSGNRSLDEAALDTLHRADPLPKIPANRPDQLELVVPVEFYVSR